MFDVRALEAYPSLGRATITLVEMMKKEIANAESSGARRGTRGQ